METENINRLVAKAIMELPPRYFSLVMATGIVSIAANLFEYGRIAWLLFKFNEVAYILLWALTLARCVLYPPRVIADLTNPAAAFGFLTTVAGTCILGVQFVILKEDYPLGFALWILGFLLWTILIYSIFTALVIREPKTDLTAINGSWLMAVVATQSVSILGMLLTPWLATRQDVFIFSSLALFLIGGMFYMLIISLVVQRLIVLPLKAEEFVPSYWINMGAAAITTLAGAVLILHSSISPLLQTTRPFLAGVTFFSWAFGAWWIPLIIILMVWRHYRKGFPIFYDDSYWSMVFPLGMYSTCTYEMAKAMDIPILRPICFLFYCAAFVAWIVVFAGFARRTSAALIKGMPR